MNPNRIFTRWLRLNSIVAPATVLVYIIFPSLYFSREVIIFGLDFTTYINPWFAVPIAILSYCAAASILLENQDYKLSTMTALAGGAALGLLSVLGALYLQNIAANLSTNIRTEILLLPAVFSFTAVCVLTSLVDWTSAVSFSLFFTYFLGIAFGSILGMVMFFASLPIILVGALTGPALKRLYKWVAIEE